jgi:hypothetical protein
MLQADGWGISRKRKRRMLPAFYRPGARYGFPLPMITELGIESSEVI